ncbi:MAG TPA: ATP-dependent 6-phosphofructokinase [Candidatus Krumholzibacteria bacterium]|nr:ATP-dependent 6-phosphofructokinase [Candidatus Krumholzibacteria bacterium]HPD72307.1 ATP-dependent 6-phosphofructokinase [Candidatus Krumholzibacteria bacterium]HRY40761.1 ATP-dependent 6-phosphofructokinase [Candidatus Krumholzibacteria bacterium]
MTHKIRRIAILTGGGDVPGLNNAMKQVFYRAMKAGIQVVGFRRGWAGLANYKIGDPDHNKQWVIELDWEHVRRIDRTGGTFLHTSRTNPASMRENDLPVHLREKYRQATFPLDITDDVIANLEDLKIDALIPIGGDDTLSYAAVLNQAGYPQIALPKTMDNDVFGTDYCIGFSTAITRAVDAIDQLRTPIGSHERIGIVEVFGRHSGETALISGYLAGVDRVVISEVPFDVDRLAKFLLEDKLGNPSKYSIMTISEGATETQGSIIQRGEADAYGHRKLGGVGLMLADQITDVTGHKVTYQDLGYMMRCGKPDALDRMVAMNFGNLAMDMLLDGASGLMVALQDGKYTTVGLNSVSSGKKHVDVDRFYDRENYRPAVSRVAQLPMFLR